MAVAPSRNPNTETGQGVGRSEAPSERVTEIRAGRAPDERVRQAEIAEQAVNETLAQVDADGLVILARSEPAILIRRRELDLHIGRDLGDQGLFFEDGVGHLQQDVPDPLLSGRAGWPSELAFLLFP